MPGLAGELLMAAAGIGIAACEPVKAGERTVAEGIDRIDLDRLLERREGLVGGLQPPQGEPQKMVAGPKLKCWPIVVRASFTARSQWRSRRATRANP